MNLDKSYEKSLINVNLFSSILTIVFIIVSLTAVIYFSGEREMEKRILEEQNSYIDSKKTQNRNIIKSVIAVIDSIIAQNPNLTKEQQQEIVFHTLRPIRFDHDDSGYIFTMELLNLKGGKNFAYENLVPVDTTKERKYISDDKKDAKGREYRKDYLKQIREKGEADVIYTYKKSNKEFDVDKLTYMKFYKKWNWIIGTGTYLDELESIKEQNRLLFRDSFTSNFSTMLAILLFFGLISIFITVSFNNRIADIFSRYSKSLQRNKKILEQYKDAVDKVSIFSKTDKNGIITYANEKFCEISGYKQYELMGKSHNIIRDPDVSDSVFKELWETIKAKFIWHGQISNIDKEGNRYYVDATVIPILDSEGQIVEYISIRNNITEFEEYKKILENQLDLSNTKLVESFQLIKEYEKAIDKATAFIKTDLNWNIQSVNVTFCQEIGIEESQLIHKEFKEFFNNEGGSPCYFDIGEFNENPSITKFTTFAINEKEYYFQSIFVPIFDLNNTIIEVLSIHHNISDIIALNKEIEDTQIEVVLTMGAIGENRSKETGNHVKRVAEYSYLFGKLLGMGEHECEILKHASPMHDIGKIAIADSILNKPGKLTEDEFSKMKQHAEFGYDMLKHSNREILKTAATIAYEHHEKFDGSGYPRGLQGEDIHIYGRITAIADVFDALGSDRVYKPAWSDEKIFELFKNERGKHFDPNLIDLFFENLDSFLTIREGLKDTIE